MTASSPSVQLTRDILTLRSEMPARLLSRIAPYAGDIGEGQREYEVEPISEPGVPEPAPAPQPSTPREPVPA